MADPQKKVSIRRKARELALQVLYQAEMADADRSTAFNIYIANYDANKKAVDYARHLVDGVSANLEELGKLIAIHSQHWRLSRMSCIDRNILRMAVFEMCMETDVPPQVAINEALEIARRFSTDESIPFINGILDALNRDKNGD